MAPPDLSAPTSLSSLLVRPVRPGEQSDWTALMAEHHYLGYRCIVGEAIRYVAVLNGAWVALLGFGAAALKCRPRDRWIGWLPTLQWQRLPWIANHVRFLILPDCHLPNLASRVLALTLKRLSADWQQRFGHPILLVETFVDPIRFQGTCYRAAGWIPLGSSRGFRRNGGRYYPHGHSRVIWARLLRPDARRLLADPVLHPLFAQKEVTMQTRALPQIDGLLEALRSIPDPRHRRGIRHPQLSILAVAICALLSGAKTMAAIAEWAALASPSMLSRLGCRHDPKRERAVPPSEPTIRRVLQRIDAERVDCAINSWLLTRVRATASAEPRLAVALDGKTVRGSRRAEAKPIHLLSAFLHQHGVVIAQRQVDAKSNEITAAAPLLEPVDLTGMVVTADAMHAQQALATFLVEEKQADYCFTVKDNQATLKDDIARLRLESFPPSV